MRKLWLLLIPVVWSSGFALLEAILSVTMTMHDLWWGFPLWMMSCLMTTFAAGGLTFLLIALAYD